MKPSREIYIPDGAQKVAMKDGAATFYLYLSSGRPAAMCFLGKAQKPSWRFWFKSEADREKKIRGQIEACQAAAAAKAKEAAERKAKAAKGHGWEKGLILVASWGYEQTNVDFYEVVELAGKSMVKIEKIGSAAANGMGSGDMSGYVMPQPKARSGQFLRCKVSASGFVKVSSCSWAHVWDGKPHYESHYA